jgi:predicted dehydrogenase
VERVPAGEGELPPVNDTLKAAVIGVGMGMYHAENYRKTPGVELAALCDADPDRLQKAAERLGVTQTFTDHRDLLETDVDVVSVALPNFLHAPIAIDLLRAGKHVLCEKPLALNAQEAEAMVAAAREAKRQLMVHFNFRFTEAATRLRKAVDEGRLGDVYFARTGWHRGRGVPGLGGWFTDKTRSGGGPLIDLGVHRLDLALWLMGYPTPVSVSGATFDHLAQAIAARSGKPYTVEDLAAGFIRFANGAALVIEASWANNAVEREEMFTTLTGTRGGAAMLNVEGGYQFRTRVFEDRDGALTETTEEIGGLDLTTPQAAFCAALCEGRPNPVPGEQGLVVMRLLDALYESAATGREVRLET